jgi:hypothetical protein
VNIFFYKYIVAYCIGITILGNWLLSIFSFIPFSVLFFSVRDALFFIFFIIYYIVNSNVKSNNLVVFNFILTALSMIFLFIEAYFFSEHSVTTILSKFRIIFAIPILFFIIYQCKVYKDADLFFLKISVNRIVNVFLIICILELSFLATQHYSDYVNYIGFYQYMQNKGAASSIGYGLLDYRLLTPVFNSSIAGLILAAISSASFKMKKNIYGLVSLLLLVLTVSKSGYLLFAILMLPVRMSIILKLLGVISLLLISFIDLSFVRDYLSNDFIYNNFASVQYHFHGLGSGLMAIFEPLGVGNTGTVLGTSEKNSVGMESAIGTAIGAIGVIYFALIAPAIIYSIKYSRSSIDFFLSYFIIASINEAAGSFYIWIVIFFILKYMHQGREFQ